MSKIQTIIIVFISSLFFTSCIISHHGNVSSGPLLNINDRYVAIAKGEARSYLVFGLGTYKNDKLVLDAKKNLYKSRPLARNEYYANFAVDISRKIIFMVAINKVTVSAEVLKTNITDTNYLFFNDKRVLKIDGGNSTTDNNVEKIGNTNLNLEVVNEIHTGDSVYFYSNSLNKFNLYLASEIDKGNVMLRPINPGIKNVLTSLNNTFYFKNAEKYNFKTGDKVSIEVEDNMNIVNKTYEGKILGISGKDILVQTTDGNNYAVLPKLVKKIK